MRLKLRLVYISDIYTMSSTDETVKRARDRAKALEQRVSRPVPLESLPTLQLGELDAQGFGGMRYIKLIYKSMKTVKITQTQRIQNFHTGTSIYPLHFFSGATVPKTEPFKKQ